MQFHNSNVFGSCIIHILYTGCDKIKKNNSGAKRLTVQVSLPYNKTGRASGTIRIGGLSGLQRMSESFGEESKSLPSSELELLICDNPKSRNDFILLSTFFFDDAGFQMHYKLYFCQHVDNCNNTNSGLDATMIILLTISISSTCFGQ